MGGEGKESTWNRYVRVIESGSARLLVLPLRIYWVPFYIRSCHRQYEAGNSCRANSVSRTRMYWSALTYHLGTRPSKYATAGILHRTEYVETFLRGSSLSLSPLRDALIFHGLINERFVEEILTVSMILGRVTTRASLSRHFLHSSLGNRVSKWLVNRFVRERI